MEAANHIAMYCTYATILHDPDFLFFKYIFYCTLGTPEPKVQEYIYILKIFGKNVYCVIKLQKILRALENYM